MIRRYEDKGIIGSGAYSVVRKAIDRETNEQVSIKIIKIPEREDERLALQRELTMLEYLDCNHESIICYRDHFEKDGKLYIISKYVDGEPVSYKLRSKDRLISLLIKIVEPFVYLHERDIVHLDIKPQNILLTRDGKIVVVDFGFACFADTDVGERILMCDTTVHGTPTYIAPELFAGRVKDIEELFAADVYSLGVTFYAIVNGQSPFTARTPKDIQRQKENNEIRMPVSAFVGVNELIKQMMSLDPYERPRMVDILVILGNMLKY